MKAGKALRSFYTEKGQCVPLSTAVEPPEEILKVNRQVPVIVLL